MLHGIMSDKNIVFTPERMKLFYIFPYKSVVIGA